MTEDRDDFDQWEDRIESLGPQGWLEADEPAADPPLDFARHVDLAAGEFFRKTWRRRLDDAQGDCGHVARQMRKAGVPLDLALAILLMPDSLHRRVQAAGGPFDAIDHPPRPSARDGFDGRAWPVRQLEAAAA
jgi:hypothetical protein